MDLKHQKTGRMSDSRGRRIRNVVGSLGVRLEGRKRSESPGDDLEGRKCGGRPGDGAGASKMMWMTWGWSWRTQNGVGGNLKTGNWLVDLGMELEGRI